MSFLDWLIVGAYVGTMFVIGFWAMTKVKDAGGFLLGKRKLNKWLMIASMFSGGTSTNHPISVTSLSYKAGFSGIWISLSYIFLMPYYWIAPPAFRRLRIVTMVDFFRLRYGKEMEIFYNVLKLTAYAVGIGVGIKTASIVVMTLVDVPLSEFAIQAIIVFAILMYCIPGGILAAYTSDLIQGLLIVVLSFMVLPFALEAIGGLEVIRDQVPEAYFQIIGNEGISASWIFWFVVGGTLTMAARPGNASYGAAKDEMAARLTVGGLIVKRVCTIGWMLIGVFAIALYGLDQANGDEVFAAVSRDVLPVGLKGLMIASILAAVMSSVDAEMVYSSSIVTNNIYREYLVKKASPRHYLNAARLNGILTVLVGWWFASHIGSIVKLILIIEQAGAPLGLSVLGAIIWRRGTRAGAIASVLVMVPLFYLGSTHWDLPLSMWVPLYLLPGVLVYIVVSLMTKQHDEESVRIFYARLDTPVGEEHLLVEQGVQVDTLEDLDGSSEVDTVKPAAGDKYLLLVDLIPWFKGLFKGRLDYAKYRTDLLGVLAMLGFVVGFIVVLIAIAKLIGP